MSLPSRTLLAAAGLLWAVSSCAQTPREPAPSLEIPTRSQAARAQQDLRGRVLQALDQPATATHPAELAGPETVVVLEQILNSPAEPQGRRERAVALLGALDEPMATSRLEALVKQKQATGFLREAAVVALAKRQGAESLATLQALLDDPAPEVRLGAARGLVMLAAPEARAALEKRLANEPEQRVREAMQRHLTRMNP